MAYGHFLPLTPCFHTLPHLTPQLSRRDCVTVTITTVCPQLSSCSLVVPARVYFLDELFLPGLSLDLPCEVSIRMSLVGLFSSLECGRGLFNCPRESRQLSTVAVTALSFLGQPPGFPSAMKWSFRFFQVGKEGEGERLHPPTPPKLVRTLQNVCVAGGRRGRGGCW